MSQARVQKLNALLARVQQRRHEPRLVAVAGGAPSANTNLAAPTLELAKPSRPAIEEVIAPSAPSSIPPPAAPSSIPPPSFRTPPPPSKPSTSTIPPSETHARAQTEVLPAAEPPPPSAGVRIAASPALPFDSAVRVASSPRIEVPKSFGDLLELSLALRPKTG